MVVKQITAKGKAGKELAPLPEIPDKRYFSISEASLLCGVKAHVLRYWEQEFPQLSPLKRKGNRRYYQSHDLLLARQIRDLLYGEGYTIHGARERLQSLCATASSEHGQTSAAQMELEMEDMPSSAHGSTNSRLRYLRSELSALIKICADKH